MAVSAEEIISSIESMSVLELNELVKALQDRIDAGVGIAAARGDIAGIAALGLVGRIGDGRADRIRAGCRRPASAPSIRGPR